MRKLWLGVVIAAIAAASPAKARDLTYSDILGDWCGDATKYVFTRSSLTVTFNGTGEKRVLRIRAFAFSEKEIDVKWEPKGNTIFGEFSKDNRNMAQQRNTSGDMGPRRIFRRCT